MRKAEATVTLAFTAENLVVAKRNENY